MSEEEKECLATLFRFALNIKRSDMPPTIWKYIKLFMPILEKKELVVSHASHKIKYHVPYLIFKYDDEDVDVLIEKLPTYENKLKENENFPKFIKYMEKYLSTPKYILKDTINITVNNVPKKLYEICANKPFVAYKNDGTRSIIHKGQSGGYIESEQNLSQEGSCWIGFGNNVCDNALITGNAYVGGGSSKIRGNVIIKDNAICHNSFIQDNVIIANNSVIKTSCIKDNVEIFGNSIVKDSDIFGNVWIENALIENKQLKDNEKIKGQGVNCSDRY